MNATTWKYHPRRSPRKRESIAARLAKVSIPFFEKAMEGYLSFGELPLRFGGTA